MDISALNNNLFAKKIQGVNPFQPVTPVKRAGADGGNPFSNDMSYVGLGIKDGAVQTSAAQLGKKAMPMRQIGIA
ncbi:MAG: hypothetical protein ACI4SM_03540 [Candidatus Gastranaerophilaceae bacterium]